MRRLAIVLLYLQAYQLGIIQSIENFSWGLLHPTLILNALLLFVTVHGVLVVIGGMSNLQIPNLPINKFMKLILDDLIDDQIR